MNDIGTHVANIIVQRIIYYNAGSVDGGDLRELLVRLGELLGRSLASRVSQERRQTVRAKQ